MLLLIFWELKVALGQAWDWVRDGTADEVGDRAEHRTGVGMGH